MRVQSDSSESGPASTSTPGRNPLPSIPIEASSDGLSTSMLNKDYCRSSALPIAPIGIRSNSTASFPHLAGPTANAFFTG